MGSSSAIDADPEQARLTVLRSYGIIDTPPEIQFDAIVQRAAGLCGAAIAALVLVDEKRCWFKARIGMEETEVARDLSFCNYGFQSAGPLVVNDARKDARFAQLPLVTKNGVVFFAGTPLITPQGHPIGTLCVADRYSRELSPEQAAALKLLSEEAMRLLEEHRAKQPALPPAPSPTSAIPSPGKLLIVDDDDAVRSFVCIATRRLGYQVMDAANGVDALQQLEKNPGEIGLILTDVNMPLMDGLELVRALKKQSIAPPVAVMSGRLDPQVRAALQAEGVTAFLNKPFSTEALKTTLRQAIARR